MNQRPDFNEPASAAESEQPRASADCCEPADMPLRKSGVEWLSDRQCLVAIVCLVLLTYSVCLTSVWAHSDDYMVIWDMSSDRTTIAKLCASMGRAVGGGFVTVAFLPVDTIGRLWIPRLISIAGIAILLCLLFVKLRQFGYSRYFACVFSALASFLPSLTLYAAWASTCFYVYAAIASVCAFSMVERAWAARSWLRRGGCTVAAVGLMVVAFHTYQPTAMFYLIPLLFLLWAPKGPATEDWRKLIFHFAIVVASLGLAFLVHKAYSSTDRGRLDLDVAKAAGWFLMEPLASSVSLIFFPREIGMTSSVAWVSVLIVVATLVGYGLYRLRDDAPPVRILKTAVALAMLPFVYLPNLVVEDRYSSYRSRGALAVAVLFLICCAVSGLIGRRASGRRWATRTKPAFLVAIVLLGLTVAQYHVVGCFIVPCQFEWRLIRQEMTLLNLSHSEPIAEVVYLTPTQQLPITRSWEYDEFGHLSIARPWVPKAICGLALAEVAPQRVNDFRRAAFQLLPPTGEAPPPAKGRWVVNGRVSNGLSDILSDSVASAPKNGQPGMYEQLMKLKDPYYSAVDQLKEDLSELNRAIEKTPDDASAYAKRGEAYEQLGKRPEALQDYNRAIELKLNSADVYFRRGTIRFLSNELDGAIDDFSNAIALDPTSPRAYTNRAVCWFKKKQFEYARADAQKSEKLGGQLNPAFVEALRSAPP